MDLLPDCILKTLPKSLQLYTGTGVQVIHVDAHSDTAPSMMGERLAHGTPFRCAWEDGILDNKRVVQVGRCYRN